MKTMKKSMALILAFVMAFSVFGMLASPATAIEDIDEIDPAYLEAVQLLIALGMIQGDENGNFDPTFILTRAHAATIVTFLLLGPDVAKGLEGASGSSTFTDVPSDHWAAGYISYCEAMGYIKGYGDGTFGPNDPLTVVQFFTLLLKALGWGQAGEYEGNGWDTRAAVKAISLGLRTALTYSSINEPMERQKAIQAAFNSLYVPMQEFNPTSGQYSALATLLIHNFLDDPDDEVGYMVGEIVLYDGAFAVKVTNANGTYYIEITVDEPDPMLVGRVAGVWAYYNDTKTEYTNLMTGIGEDFYFEDKVVELTAAQIAALKASGNPGFVIALGYESGTPTSYATNSSLITCVTTNGFRWMVTDTPTVVNGEITVKCDGKPDRLIEVDGDFDTFDSDITVDEDNIEFDLAGAGPQDIPIDRIFGDWSVFEEDDNIFYDAMYDYEDAGYTTYFFQEPASVTGTLTRINRNSAGTATSIVVGGETYEASGVDVGGSPYNMNSDLIGKSVGSNLTLFLDPFGFVLATETARDETVPDYAVWIEGGSTFTDKQIFFSKIVYPDASVQTVQTDEDYSGYAIGDIVTVEVDDDGLYVLDDSGSGVVNGLTGNVFTTTFSSITFDNLVATGTSTSTIKFPNFLSTNGNPYVKGGNNTVFVYPVGGGKYAAVTGVTNLPTFKLDSSNSISFVMPGYVPGTTITSIASFVYIDKEPEGAAPTNGLLYFDNVRQTDVKVGADNLVETDAVNLVTGEYETVLMDPAVKAVLASAGAGIYKTTINAKGNVTTMTSLASGQNLGGNICDAAAAATYTSFNFTSEGFVHDGSSYKALAAGAKLYTIVTTGPAAGTLTSKEISTTTVLPYGEYSVITTGTGATLRVKAIYQVS